MIAAVCMGESVKRLVRINAEGVAADKNDSRGADGKVAFSVSDRTRADCRSGIVAGACTYSYIVTETERSGNSFRVLFNYSSIFFVCKSSLQRKQCSYRPSDIKGSLREDTRRRPTRSRNKNRCMLTESGFFILSRQKVFACSERTSETVPCPVLLNQNPGHHPLRRLLLSSKSH